jgi:two-component system cell cycle sensor histidine kinase/response regulator CckA
MAGELILFAEDNVHQLKAMQILLEAQGYRVVPAKDGVEAVEVYRRLKSDIALVVLDIRMPKLNGWDAFQQMKKEDPQLKALVATAYATTEVRSAMTNGELHDLFIKPFSIDRFLARVSELIRESLKPQIDPLSSTKRAKDKLKTNTARDRYPQSKPNSSTS